MPKVGEMFPSKYVKKDDIGPGVLWTIKGFDQKNVAKEGEEEELKWVMTFQETHKWFTLNQTNGKRLAKMFDSTNTDDWVGKQVVLYWDPDVEYMGEIKGGVRVRAPKSAEEVKLPF